jgi:hypothetical protein
VIEEQIMHDMSILVHNTNISRIVCKVDEQANNLIIYHMWKHRNSKMSEYNGFHLILKHMHINALIASEREIGQHP